MKKFLKVLLRCIIVFAIVMLCVLIALPFVTLGKMLNIRCEYEYIDPASYGIVAQEITLKTDDDLSIATYLVEAVSPIGAVVLVSGIHNPPVRSFYSYAKMFQDIGYSTLLVEMRSHGDSDGNKISAGYDEWLDIKTGVNYIESQDAYSDLPIIAFGTSMGASTAIIATAQVKGIDGVISASAYSKWSDVAYYSMVEQMDVPISYAIVQKPFFDLNLGLSNGLQKMKYTPINQIKDIDVPILLMHSKGDTQVPFSCYESLAEAASGNNELYTYTCDGNHHFICREGFDTDPTEDKEFSEAVLGFLDRFSK